VVSTSESHNGANIRKTAGEAVKELRRICAPREGLAGGPRLGIGVGISTALDAPDQKDLSVRADAVLGERRGSAAVDLIWSLANAESMGPALEVIICMKTTREPAACA
jgi:hypothetical protein